MSLRDNELYIKVKQLKTLKNMVILLMEGLKIWKKRSEMFGILNQKKAREIKEKIENFPTD